MNSTCGRGLTVPALNLRTGTGPGSTSAFRPASKMFWYVCLYCSFTLKAHLILTQTHNPNPLLGVRNNTTSWSLFINFKTHRHKHVRCWFKIICIVYVIHLLSYYKLKISQIASFFHINFFLLNYYKKKEVRLLKKFYGIFI